MIDETGHEVVRSLFKEVRDDFLKQMREYEQSVKDSFLAALDERNAKLLEMVSKAIAEGVRVNTNHERLEKTIEEQRQTIAEQAETIVSLSDRLAELEKFAPLLKHLSQIHT